MRVNGLLNSKITNQLKTTNNDNSKRLHSNPPGIFSRTDPGQRNEQGNQHHPR